MPVTYAETRKRVFHNSAVPREYFRMKKTKIVIAGGGFAGLMRRNTSTNIWRGGPMSR